VWRRVSEIGGTSGTFDGADRPADILTPTPQGIREGPKTSEVAE
jgi:hypothetical protein